MKAPRTGHPIPESARGSVVIFVLGVVLLAAFLLTRLMDRAAVELAAENRAARRADLRQEAISALETSLAVLADFAAADNGLFDPADGWDRPLARLDYRPAEGFSAEVVVEDETGKLSLPLADEARLAAYLDAIGCSEAAADRLVDAMLTWTRPDHVSLEGDSLEFAAATLPYEPPLRALRSFEELRALPAARELFFDEQGRWNELGARFKAGASLFAFSATNANTAGADALLAQGLDDAQTSAIEAARRGGARNGAAYRDAAQLAAASGRGAVPPGLGTEAQCLHLIVTTTQGGTRYRLDVWVARPGASAGAGPALRGDQSPQPPVVASVRASPRNKFDYPFQILELREYDGQ